MNINDKISTLENLENKSCEVKLFIDIIKDLQDEIENLSNENHLLREYIDTIEEDLREVESLLSVEDDELEIDNFDEEEFVQINCNSCKESLYIDKEIYESEENFDCPSCGNLITFVKN